MVHTITTDDIIYKQMYSASISEECKCIMHQVVKSLPSRARKYTVIIHLQHAQKRGEINTQQTRSNLQSTYTKRKGDKTNRVFFNHSIEERPQYITLHKLTYTYEYTIILPLPKKFLYDVGYKKH